MGSPQIPEGAYMLSRRIRRPNAVAVILDMADIGLNEDSLHLHMIPQKKVLFDISGYQSVAVEVSPIARNISE